MTPLEAVTGEKPDISKLIPFYAPGVYHLTKEEREGKAWLYKAEACRFLGYSEHGADSLIIVSLRNRAIASRAAVWRASSWLRERNPALCQLRSRAA